VTQPIQSYAAIARSGRSLHSPTYSDQIAWTPRTVLGLVLVQRPAKCPFGVQASPSGIRRTTWSFWTVHRLGPSGVQVESDLPVSRSSSDSLLLYFKKYLC
jgi:hypothetical protein